MTTKTKIVLDSDVVIHFAKGGLLSKMLDIFPEYQYVILDVVYDELCLNHSLKIQIENTFIFFSNRFIKIKFDPKGNSRLEYARLRNSLLLGKGESACMIYCRENKDVLASSNLKDIKKYCEENQIAYLTTVDFLYYAYIRNKLTTQEIDQFIIDVKNKGSKLPDIDIEKYIPAISL